MQIYTMIRDRWQHMNRYSLLAMRLGFSLMLCFYIVAIVARLCAPYANYYNAMTLYRGALEAAPACLAVGVITGLLGDLMLGPVPAKEKDEDETR